MPDGVFSSSQCNVENDSLVFPLSFLLQLYGVVMRTNIAFRANRKGLNMTTETRFSKLLAASPDTLAKIDTLLEGKQIETDTGDRKLLTLMDAARVTGLSRMTIHRMCADGRLATIQTRAGRRRIASAALTAFLSGKVA